MTDTTDLSKLSSDDIIVKILNLRLTCSDDVAGQKELRAKLRPLVVILKQAVIREASVGVVSIKHDCTLHDTLEHCRLTWIAEVKRGKYEDYDLIPKETK